jgi:hypothetical protein
MELVIWGLLVGMVGMVWLFAGAVLMEREHPRKEHDPQKTDPEHDDHASSVSIHSHKQMAA